jgi:uncharacterized protein (DUF427 family)
LEAVDDLVEIDVAGVVIARTKSALRCLETSHPPVYYIPRAAFVDGVLQPSRARATICEFKGQARYFDIVVGTHRIERAAWDYPHPVEAFAGIRDHLAVYPSKMSECRVAGEVVRAQEGDFYGGWITSWITGPFKGGAGTLGW